MISSRSSRPPRSNARGGAGLDNVRLYVKRADLAPVLVKPFRASYKDGTSIALEPGVAVIGGKIGFGRGVVPVTIPAGSLGIAYAPHKIAAVAKPDKRKFLLDQATDVRLGDATFPLGPWVSGSASLRGDRMMVPIAARCMAAVISAPKAHVHAGVAINQAIADAPIAGRVGARGDGSYLPAGTKLTSQKGDHVVAMPKAGARACSERARIRSCLR